MEKREQDRLTPMRYPSPPRTTGALTQKKMKILMCGYKLAGWLLPALLGLCVLTTFCKAAPVVSYSPATLNFSPAGPYSPPRDEAVGSTLATATIGISTSNLPNLLGIYACTIRQTVTVVGTEVSSGIYPTGINGLGISFYFNSTLITNANNGLIIDTFFNTGSGPLPGINAHLVVTGQIAPGSVASSTSFVRINYKTGLLNPLLSCLGLNISTLIGWSQTDLLNTGNITVSPVTCSVTTPSVSVTLPTVSTTSLSSLGQTSGNTRFNIGLSCQSGANVYVTLTDATTPGNTTSLLSLNPSSTAGGVKLRVLKNDGNPVSFGPDSAAAGNTNQWLVGSSASTSNIPLIVQYYRTGNLTAGTVNAVATFTMSYQ
jgi:type 1 fimbria pilin